jgi:transcriptional regulator with XRE-family HTH domain
MDLRPSRRELGTRIAEFRKSKGLSQEDLAKLLNIPRPSLAQIELGKRNISVMELIRLSNALKISYEKLLARDIKKNIEEIDLAEQVENKQPDIRISLPELNIEKFKHILLYILEKTAGKPNVGETVLYKLLYFCDFNYYELYEAHLTGAEYRKLPYGPVPQKLDGILNQMLLNKQIHRMKTDFHGYPQTRYFPLLKPDLARISGAEKQIIDQVIERFSDWSASSISDFSHNDMPWKASRDGEVIEYELVFYREPPYSVRTYENNEELP